MRVCIVGATGNVGTSIIHALRDEPKVESIVGLARRKPSVEMPKTEWVRADIGHDDLVPIFKDAEAVVHLAWLIQPSHDLDALRKTNIVGSERVFDAVTQTGVGNLIYASSIGAYSPGPKDRRVDESWPTDGVPASSYSWHKSQVERLLDSFEEAHPGVRVVRMRKGLIFKRGAATEARRFFLGPLFPRTLAHPKVLRVIPNIRGIRTQAVHSLDVGEAYRLALLSDVRGPFNIAAEPEIDSESVAKMLGARLVPVPQGILRPGAALTWRLHLQPTEPGWVDLALQSPLMDVTRAQTELAWKPRFSATDAVRELLEGMARGEGEPTPPLSSRTSGRFRHEEIKAGVGRK